MTRTEKAFVVRLDKRAELEERKAFPGLRAPGEYHVAYTPAPRRRPKRKGGGV